MLKAICGSLVHLEDLNLTGCTAVSDVGLTGYHSRNGPSSIPRATGIQNKGKKESLSNVFEIRSYRDNFLWFESAFQRSKLVSKLRNFDAPLRLDWGFGMAPR